MVDPHARQHRAVSIERIHRVEPSAQPHLEHRCVEVLAGEQPQGRERPELEIRQWGLAPDLLDFRERLAQRTVFYFETCNTHALVVAHEMRRRVQAGAIAGGTQDRFQHGAGRALAVGAAHRDDRARERGGEAAENFAHPLQAERDGGRMLRLDIAQPVVERPQDRLSS